MTHAFTRKSILPKITEMDREDTSSDRETVLTLSENISLVRESQKLALTSLKTADSIMKAWDRGIITEEDALEQAMLALHAAAVWCSRLLDATGYYEEVEELPTDVRMQILWEFTNLYNDVFDERGKTVKKMFDNMNKLQALIEQVYEPMLLFLETVRC